MASPSLPPFPLARFSVEQYHRMIDSGAFTEHDRLELIDGWVVEQTAKGPGHEYAVGQGEDSLRERIPAGWHVRNQAPITLDRSEPEPDLVIARGRRSDYRQSHPHAKDVALVVEISDTTLEIDRVKGRTYGANEIPTYWIVNLVDRCVEVCSVPDAASPTGYTDRLVLGERGIVTPRIEDDELEGFPVALLLP